MPPWLAAVFDGLLGAAGPRELVLTEVIEPLERAQAEREAKAALTAKLAELEGKLKATPPAADEAVRNGANLAPDRAVGKRTWTDFLTERIG